MPSLSCVHCGGEGSVTAVFVQEDTKILSRTLIACPHCDAESHLCYGKHQGEQIATGVKIQELLQKGYQYG